MEKARARVAAVDDEPFILEAWQELLSGPYEIVCFGDAIAAHAHLMEQSTDVVLLDMRMPGMDGLELLRKLKTLRDGPEVIMVTGEGTVELAVEAMREGAYDFLCKPVTNFDEVICRIESAIERRRLRALNAQLTARLEAYGEGTELIGESAAITHVKTFIAKLRDSAAPVLVTGESGTGKELVARAIHRSSRRAAAPYLVTNCGAITDSLIDSELFGHEKGSFTGATAARRGLFEAADGGTLFLDEIGDIPLDTQVRLLRTLQEGEIRRVGSVEPTKVDVRVVAATNVDVDERIREGRFREDLFYRISTFRIVVPPLRDRLDDVPLIAQYFLKRAARRMDRGEMRFSDEALELLVSFPWPGNVRQLGNVVEHGATLASGGLVLPQDLPVEVTAHPRGRGRHAGHEAMSATTGGGASSVSYALARDRMMEEFEVRYLTDLLSSTAGNLSEASRRSGIDRSNLRRMLKRHGLGTLSRA